MLPQINTKLKWRAKLSCPRFVFVLGFACLHNKQQHGMLYETKHRQKKNTQRFRWTSPFRAHRRTPHEPRMCFRCGNRVASGTLLYPFRMTSSLCWERNARRDQRMGVLYSCICWFWIGVRAVIAMQHPTLSLFHSFPSSYSSSSPSFCSLHIRYTMHAKTIYLVQQNYGEYFVWKARLKKKYESVKLWLTLASLLIYDLMIFRRQRIHQLNHQLKIQNILFQISL